MAGQEERRRVTPVDGLEAYNDMLFKLKQVDDSTEVREIDDR
jgi:hypothetical protein